MKIGDKVRIIECSIRTKSHEGSIGIIREVFPSGNVMVRSKEWRGYDCLASKVELINSHTELMDKYKVGDILVNEGLERKILAVTGLLVALSDRMDKNVFYDWYTEGELEQIGFAVKETSKKLKIHLKGEYTKEALEES